MNETNILIENMTSYELIDYLKNEANKNFQIKQILERNQIGFICNFFSEPLAKNGKYIKGVHLKDLIILYYIDYYIKNKLADCVLKIEKHLNIILLNLFEKRKISKRTNDKQNSFKSVVNFFINELTNEEKKLVVKTFNKIHKTNFSKPNEFEKEINIIVNLRNFCFHHYPIVSYFYAGKIKNGDRYYEKDGQSISLSKTIASLSNFINKHKAKKLLNKIEKILKKYSFSTEEITKHIFIEYQKIINFQALKQVQRENLHFSIIDFIDE